MTKSQVDTNIFSRKLQLLHTGKAKLLVLKFWSAFFKTKLFYSFISRTPNTMKVQVRELIFGSLDLSLNTAHENVQK